MKVLAVDPGPVQSAWVLWAGVGPVERFGIGPNHELLRDDFEMAFASRVILLIERVACYGMPVGREVFDTVFFSGQLAQQFRRHAVNRIERGQVKMQLCGTMRAKDSNIIQALKDRFGDKGTKHTPGFFYGFSKDIWQAFALAVAWFDMLEPHETVKEIRNVG